MQTPIATLVSHLREANLHSAATLVRLDLRDEAQAVLRDVFHSSNRPGVSAGAAHAWRTTTVAIVRRWEKGDDETVARAFDAWERCGCEDCALVVAERRGTACADHSADAAQAVSL